MDRARSRRPEFELPITSVRALCRLCHLLNGNPLAIQLAAAPAHYLAIDQLLEYIGNRSVQPREPTYLVNPGAHTLEAVIQWSYGLLSAREKLLLHRLSEINAALELAEAERVCADPPNSLLNASRPQMASRDVARLMQSLVSRSLVACAETASATRYSVSPSVLWYVNERRGEHQDGAWTAARRVGGAAPAAPTFAVVQTYSHRMSTPQPSDRDGDEVGNPVEQSHGGPANGIAPIKVPAAFRVRRQASHDRALAEALDLMGRSALDRRDLRSAEEYFGQSLALWHKLGDDLRAVDTLDSMARLASSNDMG
jgi:hypothetical protein